MTSGGPEDRTEEAALWRRWRAAAPQGVPGAAPDPAVLAAYAEDRLTPAAAAAVEDWLADHPEDIADILAARRATETVSAPGSVVGRAMALVAAPQPKVVPFRAKAQARTAGWRVALAWGGMAASFLVTTVVGLTLGYDTYMKVASISPSLVQETLDPPTGLFSGADEDSSI